MRRVVDAMIQNNRKSTFTVQLTSMVDMFTIMVVFLLKNYSTAAVTLPMHQGVRLPVSTATAAPVEALRIVVAQDGIFVDGQRVVELKQGILPDGITDENDADFIRPLYEHLNREAEKGRTIASQNTEFEFDGKVVLQADQRLDYGLLKKVMYTSSSAGYADLHMATLRGD